MGGLFSPREQSSTQDDDKVSDEGEAAPTQDAPDTTPDANRMINDDECPF